MERAIKYFQLAAAVWSDAIRHPFWSNAIRRPDFIFDIITSRPVEASKEVIAQAVYDAHEASDQKLGKVRIVCVV